MKITTWLIQWPHLTLKDYSPCNWTTTQTMLMTSKSCKAQLIITNKWWHHLGQRAHQISSTLRLKTCTTYSHCSSRSWTIHVRYWFAPTSTCREPWIRGGQWRRRKRPLSLCKSYSSPPIWLQINNRCSSNSSKSSNSNSIHNSSSTLISMGRYLKSMTTMMRRSKKRRKVKLLWKATKLNMVSFKSSNSSTSNILIRVNSKCSSSKDTRRKMSLKTSTRWLRVR